jgi:phosphatidylinositol alpha-mannosyltransferase
MAVSKPIIASDIEGYANVLTHGAEGLMVPPKNVEKLTESMITLMKDKPLRQQMGTRGKLKAMEYDWAHVAQRVLDFYLETLNDSSQKEPIQEKEAMPVSTASGKH